MLYGIYTFDTDYSMRIDDLAREVEQRGFESLWVPEHTHIPVSRESPRPEGGDLPQHYWHLHDPFVALSFAAAATKSLKLGTGICLLTEREPFATAKTIASLDQLSGGRFLFGIGAGWNAEELANHGVAFRSRFSVLREHVQALKALWTQDEPSFHGEHVKFDPVWSWPKPLQKPHPPISLGGESAQTRQRVVEYCDGWIPQGGDPDHIIAGIADLRERAVAAGRDPGTISVSVYGAAKDPATLERYAAAGVTRVIFGLPARDPSAILPALDHCVTLMR